MKETIERLTRREARQLGRYNSGLSDDAVRQRFAVTDIARLASNENPLGMSALADSALRTEVTRTACYPDPASLQLRAVIAARTGMAPEQVVMGNGSENLLEMLCLAFLNPGDRVVTLVPSFGLHHLYPKMLGAEVTLVPVNAQMEYDLDACAQELAQPAKMMVFSNPSNPVGCMLGREGFERLIAMTPQDCVLVIGEAYYEYCAAHPDYPDSLSVLRQQARHVDCVAYLFQGIRPGWVACGVWFSVSCRDSGATRSRAYTVQYQPYGAGCGTGGAVGCGARGTQCHPCLPATGLAQRSIARLGMVCGSVAGQFPVCEY